jgi:hypothetical protein
MSTPTSFPPAVARAPHPTLDPQLVPERRGSVVILSHSRRDADWVLPRLYRIVAFWGNMEIDLTRALVSSGTSQIEIRRIMGSVEISVPPDLRIDCEVDTVLGSADVKRAIASTTSADAPLVRITGSVLLGSVEIKVVDPDAPGFMERIRRKFASKGER